MTTRVVVDIDSGDEVPDVGYKDVRLRQLKLEDIDSIKILCREWFPIEYPEQWFFDISTSQRFFTSVAVQEHRDDLEGLDDRDGKERLEGQESREEIIGLIVAENKQQSRCNYEDQGLVSRGLLCSDPVVSYILSLGVIKSRRREGIASSLLNHLILHLTNRSSMNGPSKNEPDSKAIYLHVLSTNLGAIEFYRRQGFQLHKDLPLYYVIEGRCHDGCSYVKYINSGHPPWTVSRLIRHVCAVIYRYSCLNLLIKCPLLVLCWAAPSKGILRRMILSLSCRLYSWMACGKLTSTNPTTSSSLNNQVKYNHLINQV